MHVNMNSMTAREMQIAQTGTSVPSKKPTWNNNKIYNYVDDYGNEAIEYGRQCQRYYAGITAKDGIMTTDELKKQIGEMFPMYTITNRKPSDVVNGKTLLYIDESNLKKMANDPDFRAKVYGLLDREYTCAQTVRLRYSDGKVVNEHITGSYFTLCNENKKYAGADGVPYLGGCSTDHPWSSSDSHPQFRSQSSISDHINPAKSAAKERASAKKNDRTSWEKLLAARRAKKLKEKKLAEKKAAKQKIERHQNFDYRV